ncbi:MAG: hypothetical protein D6791_11085, partial [Chloroflexi bacterium]
LHAPERGLARVREAAVLVVALLAIEPVLDRLLGQVVVGPVKPGHIVGGVHVREAAGRHIGMVRPVEAAPEEQGLGAVLLTRFGTQRYQG